MHPNLDQLFASQLASWSQTEGRIDLFPCEDTIENLVDKASQQPGRGKNDMIYP